MRKLIFLTAVAALCAAGPALAKPGQGHGKSAAAASGKASGKVTTKGGTVRAKSDMRARAAVQPARIDRNRDGIDDRRQNRYGGAACPPGLAKKSPGCVPPGQARKLFSEGQRVPAGYNGYTPYEALPAGYRAQLDPALRYIQQDQRVYVVDPATQIVTRILQGL
jgi:hypothetical protein